MTSLSPDGPTATGSTSLGHKILPTLIALLILLGTVAYLWNANPSQETADLAGYVFDSDSKPIQGAKVTIEGLSGMVAVETSSDGTFTIKGIPRKYGEQVRIRVVKEGYRPNPYTEEVVLGALLPPVKLSKEK